jgi:hypothetical protein
MRQRGGGCRRARLQKAASGNCHSLDSQLQFGCDADFQWILLRTVFAGRHGTVNTSPEEK